MFNKVILTGILEEVNEEENSIVVSVPSGSEPLDFVFKLETSIIDEIIKQYERYKVLISIEGFLGQDEHGIAIMPVNVSTVTLDEEPVLKYS